MPELACCLQRIPGNGRYWLRHARIDTAFLTEGMLAYGPDGMALADLRIEEGRIRAVLPAGEAPCCAPGLELRGGIVRPADPEGWIGPGCPADLIVTFPEGRRLDLRAGCPMPDGRLE
jgi:hypothetical protein